MTKIYTDKMTVEKESNPLTVDDKKTAEMVKKAKELLTKPIEDKELMDALEQYYVFELNEHYTSAQLGAIVKQVRDEVVPKAEPEELEAVIK